MGLPQSLLLRRHTKLGGHTSNESGIGAAQSREWSESHPSILCVGIALLWILFSNIDIFSGPETFFELPQGLPDTTFHERAPLPESLVSFFFQMDHKPKERARFLFFHTVRRRLVFDDRNALNGWIGREVWLTYIFAATFGFAFSGCSMEFSSWAGDILLDVWPCRTPRSLSLAANWGARTLLIAGRARDLRLFAPFCLTFLGTTGGHRSQPTGSGRGSRSSSRCARLPQTR